MKTFEEILMDSGISISDEQKTQISKSFNENYISLETYQKDKIEYDKAVSKLKEDLDKANETIEHTGKKIENFEDDNGEMENLKDSLKTYKENFEKSQAAIKELEINAKIEKVLGDRKFINDYTKKAIIDEIKNAHKEDDTKGIETYAKKITEGKEFIFLPTHNVVNMSGENSVQENKVDSNDAFIAGFSNY